MSELLLLLLKHGMHLQGMENSKRTCRRFPCVWPGCSAVLSRKAHLERHVQSVHKRQAAGKSIICPYEGCSKPFGRSDSLSNHIKFTHKNQKSFSCTRCSSSFARKADLQQHDATVHDQEKPYSCDICSQAFSQSSNLAKHIHNVHEGLKGFHCSRCSYMATQKVHLQQHVTAVHDKQKSFCCNYTGCTAEFGYKSALVRHVDVVHLGIKEYVCSFPLCGHRFASQKDLTKHFQAMHSEEGQQRQKREEQKVAKALEAAGIYFKREHHVSFDCWDDTFARLDFLVLKPSCCILVEVDEGEHEWYGIECEVSRMTKVHAAFAVEGNTLPLLFIRYNPHAFKVDGQLCAVGTGNRLARLVQFVQDWQCVPAKALEVQYMFYSCEKQEGALSLTIWSDAAYNSEVRACCREPVV